MACTFPSPFPCSLEEGGATEKYPSDRQHLFQNPVFTDDGLGTGLGMGGLGTPVSDYTAGYQVGGSAQQGIQEVKIAPACRPSALCPRPGPGLGSRSYSGAWESYIPGRKAPSQPPPPLFPSLRLLATVGPCPAGRGRKGGPRLKEEGGGGVRRAVPLMMPKVPDPETASGRSSASALGTKTGN